VINEPFEVRCKKAEETLRAWTRLQEIPVHNESRSEERVQCKNKIFALLSDPLQIGLDKLLASPAMLEDFIKLVRAMYGEDATHFALTTIATEKQMVAAAVRSAAAQYKARMTDQGAF